MVILDLPETPVSFKSIQPYLKIASEHDSRDVVVSYWARFYAAQTALSLSKNKTSEETNFLIKLMTWLEETKKELSDNEAITNEVAAQAHLENWTLKLFLYADQNDRASNFSKSVIQSFYTAGMLYDIITIFGDLTEEAVQNRKYAKWKAAYIHNCLKNGETPIAGPIDQEKSDNPSDSAIEEDENEENTEPSNSNSDFPSVPSRSNSEEAPNSPSIQPYPNIPSSENNAFDPAPTPTTPQVQPDFSPTSRTGSTNLSSEQMHKAQKYIKWAGSAIDYEDVATSIENLQKALRLLTTGQDS